MPDTTYQPAIRREKNGNQLAIGNGGTFVQEAGSTHLTTDGIGASVDSTTPGVTTQDKIGQVHRTRITLGSEVVVTTDHTTNGAQGTLPIYNFPRGNIQLLGASTNLTLTGDGTGVTSTAAVVAAIGSAVPAADATLTSTEADMVPSTACSLTASAGVFKGKGTTMNHWDNTTTTNSTNLVANLNFAIPDAGSTANGSLTVTGTIDLVWINLGDS